MNKLLILWQRLSIALALLVQVRGTREWASEPAQTWAKDVPVGSTKITALDVICGKEYMTVRAEFSAPFQGLISSKGTYGHENCVYVKPYSGITHATFNVRYDQCGTKPDLQGKYYENTIVIQYGPDIIEAWDEAKRLRCEWFEAYEKPATFRPAIPVADLDVIEMNFQGDEIDCWMSIQEGKGPWAREVSRIVAVGQPMTIVVAINDYKNQFDMRVKSCFAHDGVKPAIHLTDQYGCVLRPKMLSPFKKIRDTKGKATLVSYAQFLAFKFPDSMDVQIQCTVEVCRHGCADACQVEGPNQANPSLQVSADIPHSSADHMMSNEDITPSENEAQPVYQDLGLSRQPSIALNSDIDSYSDLKNGEIASVEDRIHESYDERIPIHSNQKSSLNMNVVNSGEAMAAHESENKPVIKLPDLPPPQIDAGLRHKINLPGFGNIDMRPEDLDLANKLLGNKANIDFNHLAATFANGFPQKDLMSLIQKNNVKDLVSKFANRVEMQPIAEALHSNQLNSENFDNSSQVLAVTEQSLLDDNRQTQSSVHFVRNTILADPEVDASEMLSRPQPFPQNFNRFPLDNNFPNIRFNNHFHKKMAIHLADNQEVSPSAQVVAVPLQPGSPMIPHIQNQINNPVPQSDLTLLQKVKNKIKDLKPDILNIKLHSKIGPDSQFPFGPRSLRIKRSSESSQIGLKKGFQVVTSVDLAFMPNFTTDSAPIYSGRIDDQKHGMCFSVAQLATGLSCILWLIAVAFTSCAFMTYKLNKKNNKSIASHN